MTITIGIQNLKCGGCANTITSKVSNIENISNVTVDVDNSSVSFNYETENDLHNAKNKLASIGYPTEGEKNSVISKTKSFVSCATGKMSS